VGILTNRDIRFERNLEQPISDDDEEAHHDRRGHVGRGAGELLHKNRIEKLLAIDGGGSLKGLVTISDIEKAQRTRWPPRTSSGACARARRRHGFDRDERVDALMKAGCDVICIDTAHGH
jgi:IMP dehydrogenase